MICENVNGLADVKRIFRNRSLITPPVGWVGVVVFWRGRGRLKREVFVRNVKEAKFYDTATEV